jgi:hypothetical protein
MCSVGIGLCDGPVSSTEQSYRVRVIQKPKQWGGRDSDLICSAREKQSSIMVLHRMKLHSGQTAVHVILHFI